MLIRGHPDFLILPSKGLSAERKREVGLKPEVQGLWAFARCGDGAKPRFHKANA